MDNKQLTTRQKLHKGTLAFDTYIYSLLIPIFFIILEILHMIFGFQTALIYVLFLLATILVHRNYRKLKLSKAVYIAPILMYLFQAITLTLVITAPLYLKFPNNAAIVLFIGIAVILGMVVEPLVIIFFFISAHKVKKQCPNMMQELHEARKEYKLSKNSL
jgi:hypothetical protein